MINPFSVVGLDLSLTGTGVACCGDTRTIKSDAKLPIEPRVDCILSDLFSAVDTLSNESASLFVIEGLAFASKTGKVAERAFLHHEVRYQLWKSGKKFVIVPPNTLKLFVSGKGNSDKDTMVIATTKLWPEFGAKNNNESDAVGLYQMGVTYCMGKPLGTDVPALNRKALDKVEW